MIQRLDGPKGGSNHRHWLNLHISSQLWLALAEWQLILVKMHGMYQYTTLDYWTFGLTTCAPVLQ